MSYINYCIITNRVSNVGGAQLYTLRRAKYLKSKGIKVSIVVIDHGEFVFKDEYQDTPILILPEISNAPFLLGQKRSDDLKRQIIQFLGESQATGLVIETHSPILSIWGEIVAEALKAKHIAYFLAEHRLSSNSYKPYREYFIWKLKRNELLGISNVSLKLVLEDQFDSEYNNYVNVPFEASEISEVSNPPFTRNAADNAFVIATVSRLAKSYVEELITTIISFSEKQNNQKLHLIVAGDDSNKTIIERFKAKYGGKKNNLEISFPGYIKPLGKDFFNSIDVFLGMGTSVVSAASQKCATITIDPDSTKASGIFGITNFNFGYPENGALYATEDLLASLINDGELLQKARVLALDTFEKDFSLAITMKKLDDFIGSDFDGAYWDFSRFYKQNVRAKLLLRKAKSKLYVFTNSLIKKIK